MISICLFIYTDYNQPSVDMSTSLKFPHGFLQIQLHVNFVYIKCGPAFHNCIYRTRSEKLREMHHLM